MSLKKQGQWLDFPRDSSANTIRLSTACVSTCAESTAHFTTVRAGGKIIGVNNQLTESPQTVQVVVAPDQE
jgi:hypothetical protein